ncbi:hypothetical protein MMC09_000734 [Bachmanniomyces sp. S44760]|nr:hypothetical protein [Bachmanniomyces sp. S44760]
MAVTMSLPTLLSSLTQSLQSAAEAIPDASTITTPVQGISLLDTKNELLLSYLQNLVFLIILKLRNGYEPTNAESPGSKESTKDDEQDKAVKKLVELRVYLEKGVRPLESRLKYQIDKILRAADDVAQANAQKANGLASSKLVANGSKVQGPDSDTDNDSDGTTSNDEDAGHHAPPEIDDLAYRPNPSSLLRPSNQTDARRPSASTSHEVYRPPRITPTSLSTPTTTTRGAESKARKPTKSATLDEFVSNELSAIPIAEPSIGSTIINGGRRNKSAKERAADAEKRVYEESNFVRLPKESKKDRAKMARTGNGGAGSLGGYGGEEFRGIGDGAERIVGLTRGGGRGVLERSRKRPVEDGPRDSGVGAGMGIGIGERFEKRMKMTMKGPRERKRKR